MTTTRSGSASCDLGVARVRRSLSKAERQSYEAHLASCDDCRLLTRLHLDVNPLGDVLPGDDAVIARALSASLARLTAPRARRFRRAVPGVLLASLWVSISAAAVLAGREVLDRWVSRDEPRAASAVVSRPRRSHVGLPISAEAKRTSGAGAVPTAAEPPAPNSSLPALAPQPQSSAAVAPANSSQRQSAPTARGAAAEPSNRSGALRNTSGMR